MFLRVDKSKTDRSNFTGMTELLETTCPVQISLPLPPEDSNATTRNIVILYILLSEVLPFWAQDGDWDLPADFAGEVGF
ncbi:hypothetical protein ACFXTI_031994 [Malus domestica]